MGAHTQGQIGDKKVEHPEVDQRLQNKLIPLYTITFFSTDRYHHYNLDCKRFWAMNKEPYHQLQLSFKQNNNTLTATSTHLPVIIIIICIKGQITEINSVLQHLQERTNPSHKHNLHRNATFFLPK
jgi:uncharacterized membrane protein